MPIRIWRYELVRRDREFERMMKVVDEGWREREAQSPLEREVDWFAEWAAEARENGVPAEEVARRWEAAERLHEVIDVRDEAWNAWHYGLADALEGYPMEAFGYPRDLGRRRRRLRDADAAASEAIDDALALIGEGGLNG